MSLVVDVRHRLGAFDLDVAFESAGRLTALFGPSGSGKTSLVNLIGGLLRPDQGRIIADGRVLVDTQAGIFVPRHRRRIGYIFQDARLFPHMTVSQNLRYGRFFTPSAERYGDMRSVVDLLGIGHLLDRRPNSLSGGEKQRVAIGRAVLASPRLVLMDEPLASLDDSRKAEILPYIERLRDEAGIPVVYVSHSLPEVARLANDVVILNAGHIATSGPVSDVLRELDLLPEDERSEGGVILDMRVKSHDEAYGMYTLASPAGEIRVTGLDMTAGSTVRVRLRARDVMVATVRPESLSALNALSGTITEIKGGDGPFTDVLINCGGSPVASRITRLSSEMLGLKPGLKVFAIVKSVSFDKANTGAVVRARQYKDATGVEEVG